MILKIGLGCVHNFMSHTLTRAETSIPFLKGKLPSQMRRFDPLKVTEIFFYFGLFKNMELSIYEKKLFTSLAY